MNRPDLESEIVALVFAPIAGEQRRKQVETRCRRRAQANPADRATSDFLHPFVRPVDGAENASRFFEEYFTRHGQGDAASGTIQELCSDLSLEQRDLVRHGWLGQVAETGGARKVPQFGDGHKGPQLAQLHSCSLSDGFNRFIGRIRRNPVHSGRVGARSETYVRST